MQSPNPHAVEIPRSIFREYDIRGQASLVSESDKLTLTADMARVIGHALGSRHSESSKALVTGDNRVSTPVLRRALAEGLCQAGSTVFVGVEEMPTGGASWLALTHDYDVVVQITGSHTPPHYNGLKITERQKHGKPSDEPDAVPAALYGPALAALYEDIVAGKLRSSHACGEVREVSGLVRKYQNALLESAKALLPAGTFKRPKGVVLDAGNGLGSYLKDVLETLGVEVHGLFLESDGRFPNHPPDPLLTRVDIARSESGVRWACEEVMHLNQSPREGRKWIAIVTDGDGDRAGMVDELGRPVRPEILGIIFYRRYLKEHAEALRLLESYGEKLCLSLDVRATTVFEELIRPFPGVLGRFIPAGYPNHRAFARSQVQRLKSLQDRLRSNEAEFRLLGKLARNYVSAEVSGHYFFNITPEKPEIVVDDGLLAGIKLLQIIDSADQDELRDQTTDSPLARLVETVPTRFTSEELRLDCPDDKKFEIVSEVKREARRRFADRIMPLSPIEILDGIKTQPPDSGLVEVDGLRVQFTDGSFFLIRASNTSPMLTFRFEGRTPEMLAARCRDAFTLLQPFKSSIQGLDTLTESRKS